MIKAIIFDYGGVLTFEGQFSQRFIDVFRSEFPGELKKSDEEIIRIIKSYWRLARTAEITADEFFQKCASEIDCNKEDFEAVSMKCMSQLNKGMLELVKELKSKYRIGLLSNHISKIIRNLIKMNKLDNLFDVVIISSEHSMFKPNADIYLKTAKMLNVKPEECIFIDDQESNITGAREVNMKTILFKNKKDLDRQLKEML